MAWGSFLVSEEFDPDEWDRCCTRCNQLLSWEGDLPECEEDAICVDCMDKELHELREKVPQLEEQLRQGKLRQKEDYFPEVANLRDRNREMHDRAQRAEVRGDRLENGLRTFHNLVCGDHAASCKCTLCCLARSALIGG